MFNALMDFFIRNIFGGVTSTGNNISMFAFLDQSGSDWVTIYTRNINLDIFNVSMSLGNYLSFIASLISIIFIFVLCCLFVYKMIKLVGGLITR